MFPARGQANARSSKMVSKYFPGTILVLSLIASFFLWSFVQTTMEQKAKKKFEDEVKETSHLIKQRLDLYVNLLYGVQGLFAASDSVKNYEWKTYVEKLDIQGRYPGIVALRYIQKLKDKELREFISHIGRDEVYAALGYPKLDIHPDTGKPERYIAKYIDPIGGNETMFGWDVAAHPGVRDALDKATDSGRIVATDRLNLLNISDYPNGVVVFVLPVYKNGANIADDLNRQSALVGFVDIVLDVRSLMNGLVSEKLGWRKIDFEVFDSEGFSSGKLLYDNNRVMTASGVWPKPRFWKTTFLEVGGQKWSLYFGTRPGFGLDRVQEKLPLLVLIGSSLVSLLLFGIFYSLSHSRSHAMGLAERMTADLRNLMSLHRAIVESASHSIISTDPKGRILSFNHAAEKMLGYRAEEVVGQGSLLMFHEPNEVGRVAADLSRETGRFITDHFEVFACQCKDGKAYEREWTYIRKDGTYLPVQLAVTSLRNPEGLITGYVGIGSDITQIKKAEEEMRQAVNIKSDFTSMVSHELRTPLVAIKESVAMVEEETTGPINEEQKDLLITAKRNVERLARLIDAVLDYQKLETHRSLFNVSSNDVNEFVRETAKAFYAVAIKRQINFELELAALLPQVAFDRDRIAQVLLNLLDNAFKFTEKGTIVVRTERSDERTVKISVEDQGIGIDPEDQLKLFQNFTQIKKGARAVGGTGLGLAISKKIVLAHHGQMGVQSQPGQGSIFYFTLPIEVSYVLT